MGNFDWNVFIDNLWERENAKGKRGVEGKGGYRNGKYYPYTTPNGNTDIGPGFDLKYQTPEFRERAKKGFTKQELDSIVQERLKKEIPHFKDRITKEGGNASRIPDNIYAGLLDMHWQLGDGLYDFNKFWKAVANNDYMGMRKESVVTYKDSEGKKHIDTGRRDFRNKNYFTPQTVTPLIPALVEHPDVLRVATPYPTQAQNTVIVPTMVPDESSYINAHPQTVSEEKANKIRSTFDAINNYNRLMEAVRIQNNPTPQYVPENASYIVSSYSEGGTINQHKLWDDLSMTEKAEMMKVAVRQGITNLSDIKQKYNEFAEGGSKEGEEGGITDEEYFNTMEKANEYKKGGGIHIAPSKKGTFTAAAKKHGKSVQAFASQVLAHPENYSPAMRKKANFARNASHWKHALGGNLFDDGGNTQSSSNYRYIQNEDGQWSRVTNDDMGRVFQGLTVTPNRTKIKYVPERIDNSEQGIKQRENFFLYRDNEGNLRGEPGLEITSPEFEILGAAPLIKGAGKVVEKVIYNKINPLGEPVIPEDYLTLKPRVIPSSNRTIIKESPFLRWGNDERFAVQPSKETYDNIVAQLREAKDYKSSSGYKNLINRFTQESKAKGLNFNENLFDDGNSSLSKLTVSNREAGHLGEYYPTTNSIDLDLSQIGDMPVPFHEGIHWQKVGSPADRIGPKFEKWLEARKAKAPNEMQLFEEFRNSPEYERYYQRRAADKAIKDKVNDALYPFADETLRSKGELQAYGLEAGKAIGIEPFSEYPGMPDALTAIEKARKYSSQLRDVKAGGEENVRRFWDILTGNYIPSVTVGTLGLKSYLNK